MPQDPWRTHTIELGDDALTALDREWLLTNGTGAFAAGTVPGCPGRRYHGLLVAATQPPVGRINALNQVWEQLVLHRPGASASQPLAFNTLSFRGPNGKVVYSPRGFELLRRFERGLSVRWHYEWGDIQFERELFLHWRAQAITLRYRVTGLDRADCRATLRLHPMVTMRDFHGLRRADTRFDHKAEDQTLRVYQDQHCLTFRLSPDPMTAAAGSDAPTTAATGNEAADPPLDAWFEPNAHWWYGVHYQTDAERGQGDAEDYFVPGALAMEIPQRDVFEATLTAALGAQPAEPCTDTEARAAHLQPIQQHLSAAPATAHNTGAAKKKRRARQTSETKETQRAETARLLGIAADDFVVGRRIGGQALSTIMAGYPWFADWGRDTFIALPGLLLETGRHQEAQQVLRAFARSLHHGLVPNRFDDYSDEAAHYNTVDASLWYIHAALQYMRITEDVQAWQDWLAPACMQIIQAYQAGTDYGIACDDDGLVTAGAHDTQLTWMDAAVGDIVFTPRPGKPVEVNALWYNALAGLAELLEQYPIQTNASHDAPAERIELDAASLKKHANRVKRAFGDVFWDNSIGHLRDHVWTDAHGQVHPDATCRPNQIFAVSLPYSPLAQTRQRHVVAAVRERLLTPVGLRTLPRDDHHYHGRYGGNQFERDAAYHRGTVWAWLIGPYAEAVLRVGRFGPKAKREAQSAIDTLLDSLRDPRATGRQTALGSVGQLHEIYEGNTNDAGWHRPVGAFAQAWSISEVLRIWRMLQR